MKILAFDVETTGLSPERHDVIQAAFIYLDNGKIIDRRVWEMAPLSPGSVDPQALAVHGMSMETIMGFRDPRHVHSEITAWLAKYIDKFDPADKAWPLAYNGSFDLTFLSAHFKAVGDQYLGSWIHMSRLLDPLALARLFQYRGWLTLPSLKLAHVAEHFDISLRAHDAMSDIEASVELWFKLNAMIDRTAAAIA